MAEFSAGLDNPGSEIDSGTQDETVRGGLSSLDNLMKLSRRDLLQVAGVALGAERFLTMTTERESVSPGERASGRKSGFRYCFNTSTIMGHRVNGSRLPIDRVVEIAAKAGYDAIEPWIDELKAYVSAGGKLSDLKKQIHEHGMTVESGIGFASWIVDDPETRKKGLEEAKTDMDLLKQIGGLRLAAPPVGATEISGFDLAKATERYRALLEIGDQMEVVPMAEVWGFSKTLTTLGEAAHIALNADHPKACILPDIYHLFKGGSGYHGVKLLSPSAVHVFHVNDVPSNFTSEKVTDADRVFPGDGIAPIAQVLRDLKSIGYNGVLSLELFNQTYWANDPLTTAKTGLEKIKKIVAAL